MSKLTLEQKHLLRLVKAGQAKDQTGWAKVSTLVWPEVNKIAPPGLLILEPTVGGGGLARLTPQGEAVLEWA